MEKQGHVTIIGATVVGSIALVVSLITSAVVASRAYVTRGEQEHKQARTLAVTGSAKSRIRSDLAVWNILVSGEGKTLQDAFQSVDDAVKRVQTFLKERSFPDPAIVIDAINTSTHYQRDTKGNETRQVASYVLSRRFRITTQEVDLVSKASGQVTELLKSGIHVESSAPQYLYTKLAELKIKIVGEATANGRLRAEEIAAQSKCIVGIVKEARAGVLQVTTPGSTEVSDRGINDTSSIDKDVTAVVHLVFTVEANPAL